MKKLNYLLFIFLAFVALGTSCSSDDDDNTVTPSSEKAIDEFKVDNINGVIDEATKTITLQFPIDAELTNIVPTIKVSGGATITPALGVSVDLNHPIMYVVKAEDGTMEHYTVVGRANFSVPLIESIDATQYTQGLGSIIIKGTNLTGRTLKGNVSFRLEGETKSYMTVPATAWNESKTIIYLSYPALDSIKPGRQELYIARKNAKSNDIRLEVLANTNPIPTITSVGPESPASGEIVTITGTHLRHYDCYARVLTPNADGKYVLLKQIETKMSSFDGTTATFTMPEVTGKFKLQVRSKGQLSNITDEYTMK